MTAQVLAKARYVNADGSFTMIGLELITALMREIAELRARVEALEGA